MKLSKEFYTLLILIACLTSCQDWADERFAATIAKECNYNVIGISGAPSASRRAASVRRRLRR